MWFCRAEQFFELYETAETEKVKLASFHLEGNAQVWVQRRKAIGVNMNWDEFKIKLMARFGSAPYKDGFGELCKLKHTTTMREYQSKFEKLLGKVGVLTDKQEIACFISGL